MTSYIAKVTIWSDIGHTPITKRGGGFCDVLLTTEVEVKDATAAWDQLDCLVRNTEHARTGHAFIENYPNQNTRSVWYHT